MVLGQEPEMLQNGFLELPKTKYSVQSEKWLARNENKAFWQWFWARSQKCFKTAFWKFQKLEIRFRVKNRSRVMKINCSGNGLRGMLWCALDLYANLDIIHTHTRRKINKWKHKTFEFFDLHFSLFPFHAKTRSHTP